MLFQEKLKDGSAFSGTQQSIVDYILANPEPVTKMTLDELSAATYSSHATIIRVVKKLGYDSYRKFQVDLMQELTNHQYEDAEVDYSRPFPAAAEAKEIVRSLRSLYQNTINSVIPSIDIHNLQKIVQQITKSRRILLFAVGESSYTAQMFANRMIKLGYYVILATEARQDPAICWTTTRDDLAFFITYRAVHSCFLQDAKTLRTRNCPIITLTANSGATLTKLSDYRILIPNQESGDRIGTFYSQLSFEFVLSTIYSMCYELNYQKNQARILEYANLEEEH